MVKQPVEILDEGSFVIIKNPKEKPEKQIIAYPKGDFSATLEILQDRAFITITKGMGPASFVVSNFEAKNLADGGSSPIRTLKEVMKKICFPVQNAA